MIERNTGVADRVVTVALAFGVGATALLPSAACGKVAGLAEPTPSYSYEPDCSGLPPLREASETAAGQPVFVYAPLQECPGQTTALYPDDRRLGKFIMEEGQRYTISCWGGGRVLKIVALGNPENIAGTVEMGPGVSLKGRRIPLCYSGPTANPH